MTDEDKEYMEVLEKIVAGIDLGTIDRLLTRIEKLEAALRFYADHWQKQYHRDLDRVLWNFMNPDDGGKVARKALEGKDD